MEVCRICRTSDRGCLQVPSPILAKHCVPRRVLLEDAEADDMLAPCRCKGTMRWVHRGCLEDWRRSSYGSKSFFSCGMCQTKYKFESNKLDYSLGCELALFLYTAGVCALLMAVFVGIASKCRSSFEDIWPIIEESMTTTATSRTAVANGKSHFSAVFHKISTFLDLAFLDRLMSVWGVRSAFCGLSALALLELLIIDGSVGLSFNLMFSLWRLFHYNFKLDYLLSSVLIAIGLHRMASEVHLMIRMLTGRIIKLKIINHADKN